MKDLLSFDEVLDLFGMGRDELEPEENDEGLSAVELVLIVVGILVALYLVPKVF